MSNARAGLGLLVFALCLAAGRAEAHEGAHTAESWLACAEAARTDRCEYDDGVSLYRGTCQQMNAALLCVRNQPLQPVDQGALSFREHLHGPDRVISLDTAAGEES